jgi:hypothetical protein
MTGKDDYNERDREREREKLFIRSTLFRSVVARLYFHDGNVP